MRVWFTKLLCAVCLNVYNVSNLILKPIDRNMILKRVDEVQNGVQDSYTSKSVYIFKAIYSYDEMKS